VLFFLGGGEGAERAAVCAAAGRQVPQAAPGVAGPFTPAPRASRTSHRAAGGLHVPRYTDMFRVICFRDHCQQDPYVSARVSRRQRHCCCCCCCLRRAAVPGMPRRGTRLAHATCRRAQHLPHACYPRLSLTRVSHTHTHVSHARHPQWQTRAGGKDHDTIKPLARLVSALRQHDRRCVASRAGVVCRMPRGGCALRCHARSSHAQRTHTRPADT
jgi:hypothetical protein